MRIYLVTPRNPPSFWNYDSILPILGKRCLFPNLSMPTIAGLTPAEHEVVLCDENVEEVDFDREADVVGLTGYIVHRERILELADAFRRRGRLVVVGGSFASLCAEDLRGRCDVVFAGEAEETWPLFLRDLAAGRWRSEYAATELPDLTDAPAPRFDLLRVDRYHAMTVQFARGCPFTCEFCDIIVVYGRRPRTKSVANIMREIEECRRLGARQIFLVDDNFIGNKRLAKALLRELAGWNAARGYPVHFQTEMSLNVAQDDELLELLRAARFTSIFIGIESPRASSLVETRKTQNLRGDLVADVHKIQSYGIQVQAGMIVGFDHDDTSIFEEQLRFMHEARIPISMTGLLQAAPKTPLYARMVAEGRLTGDTSGDQMLLSNIRPRGMTQDALYRGYRDLVRSLYDFDNFRARVLVFLLHKGRQVAGPSGVRRDDLRLFFRILAETLVRGGRRRAWFTLRLLAGVLARRPSVFRDAVVFAIVHKAFHDYTARLCAALDGAIGRTDAEPPVDRLSDVPLAS